MVSALIVAAGKGTRMGQTGDKLFLQIGDRPVLAHTWHRFEQATLIQGIVLVVRPEMEAHVRQLAKQYAFQKPFVLVHGGKERQDSVWNGLGALPSGTEIVAIQDAARPCTSPSLISATIEAARQVGAAVAAQPMTDTVKESSDGKFVERTLDRSKLWAVQTPQTFRVEVIRHALSEVRKRGLLVTDDTAACELVRQPVQLVTVPGPNPKVTRPEDVPYVEMLLRAPESLR